MRGFFKQRNVNKKKTSMKLFYSKETFEYKTQLKTIPTTVIAFLAKQGIHNNHAEFTSGHITINPEYEEENYFKVEMQLQYTNKKNNADIQLLDQKVDLVFLLEKTCPTIQSILDEKYITLCF